jgi:hypothetical protein
VRCGKSNPWGLVGVAASGNPTCRTCPSQREVCEHVRILDLGQPAIDVGMAEAAFEQRYAKGVDPATGERAISSLSKKHVSLIDINNRPSDPAVAAVVMSRLQGTTQLPVILMEPAPGPCGCGAAHARWQRRSFPCILFGLTAFVEAECHGYQCSACGEEVHYDGGADGVLNQTHNFKFAHELLITYAQEFSTTKHCTFFSFW